MGWYIAWPIDNPQQVRMQIWNGVAYYKSLFHIEPSNVMVNETADPTAVAILHKMGLTVETLTSCPSNQMMLVLLLIDKKHDKDYYNDICDIAGLFRVGDGFVREVEA